MGSQNRIDLVLYLRLQTGGQVLSDLMDDIYAADDSWPYHVEHSAPAGEPWVSLTLASVDYDSFASTWIDPVSVETEVEQARARMQPHGLSVEGARLALVCWYDAADRPFPQK